MSLLDGPTLEPDGLNDDWCADRAMHTEDRKCIMKIRSDGQSDTESRYNFWTAAVVLTGVCIRDGQMGFGEGLGRSPISSGNVVKA